MKADVEALLKRYRLGDVREDGMVFRTYAKSRSGKVVECWMSPEAYERFKVAHSLRGVKYAQKNRERARNWREANKQRYYEKRKEERNLKKGQYAAYRKKWEAANPEKVMEICRRRQAEKLNRTPAWVQVEEWFFVQEAYALAKARTRTTGFKWEVDHIIPLKGALVSGLHVPNNLQVIPAVLNRAKRNKYEVA